MSDLTKALPFMSPEEILEKVEELEIQAGLESGAVLDPDSVELNSGVLNTLFDLMEAIKASGDIERSADLFFALKPLTLKLIEQPGQQEEGLSLLAEWSLNAMTFTPESKTDFACFPVYEELFANYAAAPPQFRIKEAKAKLQLVHHFRYWVATGGETIALDPAVLAFLNEHHDGYLVEIEEIIQQREAAEDWESVFELCLILYRYYRYNRRPNQAIANLKKVIETLPLTKDYEPALKAERLLELGTVYREYKKYETAIKYFDMARSIFDELGEDYEMFSIQAEALAEESQGNMN